MDVILIETDRQDITLSYIDVDAVDLILAFSYPEPVYTGWSSVHWNATGMPLAEPVYTGIPLGDPENTCKVHWNTTGKT